MTTKLVCKYCGNNTFTFEQLKTGRIETICHKCKAVCEEDDLVDKNNYVEPKNTSNWYGFTIDLAND